MTCGRPLILSANSKLTADEYSMLVLGLTNHWF